MYPFEYYKGPNGITHLHNLFLTLALDLCKLHVQSNAHRLCKFCTNAVGVASEAQNVCTRCFGDGDFRGNFRFWVVVFSSDLPEQMQHGVEHASTQASSQRRGLYFARFALPLQLGSSTRMFAQRT